MSRMDMSPMARDGLSIDAARTLDERAREMGVRVRAGRNTRKDCWRVVVWDSAHDRTVLEGAGALEAVIAGALEDWTEAYGA